MSASAKAKSIKLLILDVDGVLTNGTIYYGTNSTEVKGFHIHDGLGLKLLQRTGLRIAIISAKKSEAVTRRLQDLNIDLVYLGYENKLPVYIQLKSELNLSDEEIAYMGDDFPDLPVLLRAGLAISVPNACTEILEAVDYVTKKKAGSGAVREACEFIMKAQETYQSVVQFYHSK